MHPIITLGIVLLITINPLPGYAQPNDAEIIIHRLLNIPDPNHSYLDQQGKQRYNALQAYKTYEALYLRYKKQLQQQSTPAAIKYYLYIGAIAQQNRNGAITEALSSDLMPLYRRHPQHYLDVLRELPFLIPSTCYYLGNYFGFEDQ